MPVEGKEFEELVHRIQTQLPNQLYHIIKSFLPPLPPRPKYRDNGLEKELERLERSPKLTAMAFYDKTEKGGH
jgi:hypothetical protein